MHLLCWIAVLSFHSNASITAKVAKVGANAQEECYPHENTYLIKSPKGGSNHTLCSGAIVKNVISLPKKGVKNRVNEGHMGSIPFK